MKYLAAFAGASLLVLSGHAFAAPSAPDFRHQAMASDAFEIQSSKIALGQSQNPQVKAFAKMMIHDHSLTTKHLLRGSGMTQADIDTKTQPGPDGKYAANDFIDQPHADMLDKIGSESGKSFDSDYMSDQVSGHKDAVAMFQDYSQNGDDPKLKAWAAKTLPTLQMHLSKAQAIDSKL
jgi:putative membrane protein